LHGRYRGKIAEKTAERVPRSNFIIAIGDDKERARAFDAAAKVAQKI
jgi:hypothetical protein